MKVALSNRLYSVNIRQLIPFHRIRIYSLLGIIFLLCSAVLTAGAQALPNDECNGAINIPTDGSTQSNLYSNVGATLSMPGCSEAANNDIWFKFTATTKRHVIRAYRSDFSPVVIEVFKGSCGALASLVCQYAANSDVTIADLNNLVPGTTYYYRIYLPGGNNQRLNIRTYVSTPTTPLNDECSGAIPLQVNKNNSSTLVNYAVLGAVTPSLAPCNNTGYDAYDAWYSFVATAGTHKITITPTSYDDYVFEVFSGTCNNLQSFGCVNETGLNQNEIQVLRNLTPGNTYYIRVYNRYGVSGNETRLSLCINQETSSVPNDECSGAISVPTTGFNYSQFSNIGATISMPACTEPDNKDIWFKFIATAKRHKITATTSDTDPVVLEVFKGNCAALTSMGCQYPGSIIDLNNFEPGTTYYYRVYMPGGNRQSVNINTYVSTPATPANDECSGAMPLQVNKNNSSTLVNYAVLGAVTPSLPACSNTGYGAYDAWYSFVATASTHKITLTPGSYDDYIFEVFSGTCNNLQSFGCVNETGSNQSEIQVLRNLTPGNNYYIRVYHRYGVAGNETRLSLCINQETSSVPNDECSGAISVPTAGFNYSQFSNIGATVSMPACKEPDNNDIWFKFTATAKRHKITATTSDTDPVVLEVFKGTCSTLTSLGCEYSANHDYATIDLNSFEPGTTYYYRVYLPRGNRQSVNINTYVGTPATPANDECSGATRLTVNNNNSCNVVYNGALGDVSQSLPSCVNTGYKANDAWYSFVATNPTHKITLSPLVFSDYIMEAFTGTCNNLRSLGCMDKTGLNETEVQILNDLIPGNTYYIRVYDKYENAGNSSTFSICISNSIPVPDPPVLTNSGTHCAKDTLQVKVSNIKPGNIAAGYLNNVIPLNFDATNNLIWAYPVPPGYNTISVYQQNAAGTRSESVELNVNTLALVTPRLTLVTYDNYTCNGTPVTFYALPENGGNSPVYQWRVNGTDRNATGNTFTANNFKNGDEVQALLTSNQFCIATNTAISNTVTVNIYPSIKPLGSISLPVGACVNNNYAVTVHMDDAPINTVVTLTTLSNTNVPETISSQIYTGTPLTWDIAAGPVPVTQKYYAVMTPPYGTPCSESNVTDTGSIVIEQPVTAVITRQGDLLKVTHPNAATVYQWQIQSDNNWMNISSAPAPYCVIISPGKYHVLAIKGGCVTTSNELVIQQSYGINLFPNPASNNITINPLLPEDGWKSLEVIDIAGHNKLIVKNIENEVQATVNISQLPAGTYFVVLKGKNNQTIKLKFIKI